MNSRLVERPLKVGVGDERDAGGELNLRLRLHRLAQGGVCLDAGEERRRQGGDQNCPARAVPMDAPRLVAVFCKPPTSPLCSSGRADTVTLPSCEASAPTPRPASNIGQVTISGPAPASSAATMMTIPAKS